MKNTINHDYTATVTCVILAGGKARRFDGKDKGLIRVNRSSLIEHVIKQIQPQVKQIFISANRNLDEYKVFGFPVYPDTTDDFAGPLAGILTALEQMEDGLLAVMPCDMPDLPDNIISLLGQQLYQAQADICYVNNNNQTQPLLSIMQKHVQENLQQFLLDGKRKVKDWLQQQNTTMLDLNNQPVFCNINNIDDLRAFEKSDHE